MQEKQTIEALYRQHYERMLLTARALLHDDEEARDVVSDVFAELLQKGKELNGQQDENYLMVCVRNKCLNQLEHRRIVKDSEKELHPDIEDTAYAEPPLDEVLDYMNTQLTPKTKRAMTLRFLNKKKYNEIAHDMGISRIAVYKHLSSGLRLLRTHFAWYYVAIAFLLLSGVAYAIFTQIRKSSAPDSSSVPATENVSTDTRPAVIHYENVPLEQILSDIAIYNKVELRFLNERSRRFRLYYDWHQEEPVDDIARMLNTFESIHIEFRQNTLYVE